VGWAATKSWFDSQKMSFPSVKGVQTSCGGSPSLNGYWGFLSGDKVAGA